MKLFLPVAILATLLSVCAQAQTRNVVSFDSDSTTVAQAKTGKETPGERKQQKAEQKRRQHQVDSLSNVFAIDAINRNEFVFIAEQVSFMHSGMIFDGLYKNSNFIVVQGNKAMIQYSLGGSAGANGMGGLTVSGIVSNKSVEIDKNGEAYIKLHVTGSRVNADVAITLYKQCNQASAIVTSTFGSGQVRFSGTIVPYKNTDFPFDQ